MFLVPELTQTKLIFYLTNSRNNIKQILATLLTPIIKETVFLQELTVKNGVAILNSRCKNL